MSENVDLPPTSWAVLGQLTFDEELSGYDLKRWADQSLAFFYWAPSQSQIYSELRRLEGLGLVTSHTEQTHETRRRRLYAITSEGRRRMSEWMARESIDPIILKHPLLLKIWALKDGDEPDFIPKITQYRERLVARAEKAKNHAVNSSQVERWKYSTIALEWSEKFYQDEVDRLDWLTARLRATPTNGTQAV